MCLRASARVGSKKITKNKRNKKNEKKVKKSIAFNFCL
jgi:hypothetical protein